MYDENKKLKEAIEIIRDARSENDVQNAIYIKEGLIWSNIDDELKDCWYEAFGDVKHYHPVE